ncbi:DUF2809 domain-containing protein [Cryobacterium roopkundense]|uniref:ribosomal maturation YjgA family protein n=1 Tax=Cryobacterium roopkundense TaxID=1001240 RepID=UPI001362B2CD|nr:DUF2809 domain-containing protein [Cryobacterium roopkundense]
MRQRIARRRLALFAAGALVVAVGLAVHFQAGGTAASLAADALYAALVYLIVAFLAPRSAPVRVAATAAGLCVVVELFQLTGVPSLLAEAWPPTALVLGTTFVAWDLVAYLVGAALAGLADRMVSSCATVRAARGR